MNKKTRRREDTSMSTDKKKMNYKRIAMFLLLLSMLILFSKYNPTVFSSSTLIIIIGIGLIYKNEMRQLFSILSPVVIGSSNIANEEQKFFNFELFIERFKNHIREIHTLLIDHNNCCKVKYTMNDPHEWTHFTSFLNNFSNHLISIVQKSQHNIDHYAHRILLSDFVVVKEKLFELFEELEVYLMNSKAGRYAETNFTRVRKNIVQIVNIIDKNLQTQNNLHKNI